MIKFFGFVLMSKQEFERLDYLASEGSEWSREFAEADDHLKEEGDCCLFCGGDFMGDQRGRWCTVCGYTETQSASSGS